MSPADISADFNPLRLPSDRRLIRIAGPSGLIIFGVTGDLSRKKLMPAVYDLAKSAQSFDTLKASFDELAATAGESGDAMLGSLRAASAGMIADQDLIL